MRLLHRHIKPVLLVFALTMTAVDAGGSIFPGLTSPRVGDELSILRLCDKPRWGDTLSLCPDLSGAAVDGTEQMRIWSPPLSDTISYCIVTKGRETTQLVRCGDTVYRRNRVLPGQTKVYKPMPIYGMPFRVTSKDTIRTCGRTDGIGDYQTVGLWHMSKIGGLRAVTFDGDTLRNVECVRIDMRETLVYSGCDTTLYRGMIRRWYAPGYRYPLLSHE